MGPDEVQARQVLLDMQELLSRDPYEALGLIPSATAADIRNAFLAKTKQFHPARFGRMSSEIQRLANEVFLALRATHDTLARPNVVKSPSASQRPTGAIPTLAQRPGGTGATPALRPSPLSGAHRAVNPHAASGTAGPHAAIGHGNGHAGPGGAGQGHAGQGGAGQGHAGQGHAGQGHAGQGHAGQGHAGQGHGQANSGAGHGNGGGGTGHGASGSSPNPTIARPANWPSSTPATRPGTAPGPLRPPTGPMRTIEPSTSGRVPTASGAVPASGGSGARSTGGMPPVSGGSAARSGALPPVSGANGSRPHGSSGPVPTSGARPGASGPHGVSGSGPRTSPVSGGASGTSGGASGTSGGASGTSGGASGTSGGVSGTGPRPMPGGASAGAPVERELVPIFELFAQGQLAAARVALETLVGRAPQSTRYRSLLAFARGREAQLSGRVDEARVELQDALTLDPDLQLAKTALAELFTRRR